MKSVFRSLSFLPFWQIKDVSSHLLLRPQGAVWVCRRSFQTSGPGWWSESSPWSTLSTSSVTTTLSVSANTPNSCCPLGTSHANCAYRWALGRRKAEDKNQQQPNVVNIFDKHKTVFLNAGVQGFCRCQSTVSGPSNWSGHC